VKIEWIKIKGFRNFEECKINFSDQTLIIGANDVGKTNLIYALRLLFDRSLSEQDLDLNGSDYNVYSEAQTVEITVKITDVIEDCLISTFKGDIKEETVFIQYRNEKNGEYSIYTGYSEETLELKTSRFYIKRLNLEYVNTNRNLSSFMKREKNHILEDSKASLDELKDMEDKNSIQGMTEDLSVLNSKIDNLNYVKKSLDHVNSELGYLAIHNENKKLSFATANSDITSMLNNMELSYSENDATLAIGGDGRNNQIFLATWAARQKNKKSLEKVTFFAIEEPEAHLHPHQQRKLSSYLLDKFEEQIFITTHSPYIASDFRPDKIARLYSQHHQTKVAKGGCSEELKLDFDDFGYRLDAITSDVFFVNAVLLVEGPSEKLFYTALAKELKIDLDRLNISIIPVNGVGFKPYIKICLALDIPFVLRTDRDIFKKTKKNEEDVQIELFYNAGVSRVMGIYEELLENEPLTNHWKTNKTFNEWAALLGKDNIPAKAKELEEYIRTEIDKDNIFLASVDLEIDLVKSELFQALSTYYKSPIKSTIIKCMQDAKAENMLKFLEKHSNELEILKENAIIEPLKRVQELAEKVVLEDG